MRNKKLAILLLSAWLLGLWTLSVWAQDTPQIGIVVNTTPPQVVLNYWTPEKMRNAIPVKLPLIKEREASDDFVDSGIAEPQVVQPSQLPVFHPGPRNSVATLPALNNSTETGVITTFSYPYPFTRFDVLPLLYEQGSNLVFPYTAIGKVFVRFPGDVADGECSGAVIAPHLVLTARHCIFKYATQQWATHVIFAPGYRNGSTNLDLGGGWAYNRLATWVSGSSGYQYDIGFIQLLDDDLVGCGRSAGGNPVESYTGILGFSYGGDYSKQHWNMFGYPADPPFDGQRMIEAQSSTGTLNPFSESNTVEVGNDMTPGSSGGPWILSFAPGVDGAVNLINGLNSFKYVTRPLAMVSPQFMNSNFNGLFSGARGLSCP